MQLNSTPIHGLSTRYNPSDHMAYFQAQSSIVEQKYDMERLCLLALLSPLLQVVDNLLLKAV
jgi:hypothetical protein